MKIRELPVPAELIQFADHEGLDYPGTLRKALDRDGAALHSLFIFSEKTNEENSPSHGHILSELLTIFGDEKFAANMNDLTEKERMSLLAEMKMAGDDLWKNAPVTWGSFFPDKKVGPYRGLYVFSREAKHTFRFCENPTEKFVAIDETGQVGREYLKVLRKPYPGQAMYAEVRGFATSKYAGQELPTNFSGFFIVTDVLRLSKKSHLDECMSSDLWAYGPDKIWALQISELEGLIEFKGPKRERLFHFPFSPPIETDTALVYESVNENTGDNIWAVVKNGACEIETSEAGFSKPVQVRMNGQLFLGCGKGAE